MCDKKKELRKQMKELRGKLGADEKRKLDECVFDNFINNPVYARADSIFAFVSFGDEVDTHKIIEHALEHGKRVCVPKVISKESGMIAVELESFQDLAPGAYGILEPVNAANAVEENSIDLAIVPGLAFDFAGGRLGYGGGYYDRFLSKLKDNAFKVGLCFDFQIIENVPTSKFDVALDGIISN